jgi:hypothetical protein
MVVSSQLDACFEFSLLDDVEVSTRNEFRSLSGVRKLNGNPIFKRSVSVLRMVPVTSAAASAERALLSNSPGRLHLRPFEKRRQGAAE